MEDAKKGRFKRLHISRDVFEAIEPWAKHYNKPTVLYIEEIIVKSFMNNEIHSQKEEIDTMKIEYKGKSSRYERAKDIVKNVFYVINPVLWIVYGVLWVKDKNK